MIIRNLEVPIKRYMSEYPVIAIVGPRQSGKTTLARYMFPEHKYLSMENLDLRKKAEEDPRGFLDDYPANLILDEVQRVPQLFSYLQERVDLKDSPASYILTGSKQFLLMEKITQSLSGRIVTFKLYPFTVTELFNANPDTDIDSIFKIKPDNILKQEKIDINSLIFSGMFPRIHDKKLDARKWIENYILTYIERDIRSLVSVDNLRVFENFIKACAASAGQLINYTSIANLIGTSLPTVKKWISLLETSGIVFLLQPYHKNFNKRLVKTPKLYFTDTGIVSYLLSIKNPDELKNHPLYGNLFENFIISEIYKRINHIGEQPPLFFWRDKTGNEIDLIIEKKELLPIEIKSSRTYNSSFSASVSTWLALKGNEAEKGFVIYRGDDIHGKNTSVATLPWWVL